MNKQDLLSQMSKLEAEAQELRSKLEQLEDNSSSSRWRAGINEKYWYLDCFGESMSTKEVAHLVDKYMHDSGNYFKTKAEANQYKARLLAKQELRDLCDGGYVFFSYTPTDDSFKILRNGHYFHSPYRFSSEEKAVEALKQLGEEKLKLVWGVK